MMTTGMTPWLSIVGLGEDGLDGVCPAGRPLIEQAETLVGGDRHLVMVPANHPAERLSWASPLSETVAAIVARRGRRVCVLATGDPLWYGIGVTLAEAVPAAERCIVPAPSAFSLACARLGWPLAETETLTLHGRPLDLLRAHLAPAARLLILANDGETPARVAALLGEAGYGESPVSVFEHMGGGAERRVDGTAKGWRGEPIAALNTIAVECRAGAGAVALSRAPGLPDDAFENDGQLTKREVRGATLAALAPLPGQRLWDVGAGCGSVAIEWLRTARGTNAIAIERQPARAAIDRAQRHRAGYARTRDRHRRRACGPGRPRGPGRGVHRWRHLDGRVDGDVLGGSVTGRASCRQRCHGRGRGRHHRVA